MDITANQKTEILDLRNKGKSYFDISVELGIPEASVSKHLRNNPDVTYKQSKGKPISAELIKKMVILRNEGNTYPKIAAELDLHKESVGKYLRKHPDVTYKSRGS